MALTEANFAYLYAMQNATVLNPVLTIRVSNRLGEGIVWNHRRNELWWTDIPECRLYRYEWSTRRLTAFKTPERLASFAFVRGTDVLLGAFATGLGFYSALTEDITWLARPFTANLGVRFNDGRCDRGGRFWTATMVEALHGASSGALYSFDSSSGLRQQLSGIQLGNGLCMSPDGQKLYLADSVKRTIQVCEMDDTLGAVNTPRLFATTPEGSYPDGAAIDEQGYIWSAHWGGGAIVRYSPNGQVDYVLPVPVSQPTCLCFGGPALSLLCVSTARDGLSTDKLRLQPEAGNVLIYRTGHRGVPEEEYQP